jgi:hypothetical protein
VERQAGPDFAGRHHPVLGHRRDLQFIVLEWAKTALHMSYEKATSMVGLVGVGVTVGAILSAQA